MPNACAPTPPELGLLDADTTLQLDKPELRVEIDRDRAAKLGVSTSDIADALRIMVGGEERVSRFRDESMNEDYDVQLRLEERRPERPGRHRPAVRAAPGGGLVRLDNVVSLVPTQTASRIDRLDRQRHVSLRAAVAPGYALADRIAASAGRGPPNGLAHGLLHARFRPGPRNGNHLPGVPSGRSCSPSC